MRCRHWTPWSDYRASPDRSRRRAGGSTATAPLALIAELHRVRLTPDAEAYAVDDRTWADLDLDAVFAHLDRTDSTVGQQALYRRLRSGRRDDLAAFEALIAWATARPDERAPVQRALARLRETAGYQLASLAAEPVHSPHWHLLFPVLTGAMVAALAIATIHPLGLLVAITLAVVNVLIRIVMAGRTGDPLHVFRQVGPLMAAATAVTRLEVPAAARILDPARRALPELRRLRRWTRLSGRVQADPLTEAVLEYVNFVFLVDANALVFGVRELARRGATLLTLVEAVGDVDAAIAIASVRAAAASWTRPTIAAPGAAAGAADLRHPLLAAAVPSSIALGPPHGVLVTGANMSGKSTFLRTVGVNVVLAQTIHTCFASAYDAPSLAVRSLMSRTDDLASGRSSYLVDVERVVALLAADAPARLILVDELFRGTNAVERIAAATAVLGHFARRTQAAADIVIAATHDAELLTLLPDFAPCHLLDGLGPAGPEFYYRLTPGPATTRNAIALLELYGAPPDVLARSRALTETLERGGRWAAQAASADPLP